SPLAVVGKTDIEDDRSISAVFHQPQPEGLHMAVLLPGVQLPRRMLSSADLEFARTGGKSGGRFGSQHHSSENNREFGQFYRQQGNDVSQDRGRGPRRYDEQGNVNPEYHSHYRGRGGGGGGHSGSSRPNYNQQYRPPAHGSNGYSYNGGGYRGGGGGGGYRGGGSHRGGGGYNSNNNGPPPPRPMGYQPFAGRRGQPPAGTPIDAPSVHGPPRGPPSRGNYRGSQSRGGYSGGYRGRGGY
ncbi:hypothetical protein IWW38_004816, partial [Coemansia aciculifera]